MLLIKQIFDSKSAPLFLACWVILTTLFARHSAAILLIFITLLTLRHYWQHKEIFKLTRSPSYWLFYLMSIWIGISCFWNPEPSRSLATFLSFGFISLSGIILIESVQNIKLDQTRFTLKALPIAVSVALAFIGLIILNDYFLHFKVLKAIFTERSLNYAGSLLTLLLFPTTLALLEQKRFYASGVFLCTCILVILSLHNETAKIALFLGLLMGIANYFASYLVIRSLKILIPILMLTAPILPKMIVTPENLRAYFNDEQIRLSFMHRLYIWSSVSDKIAIHPFHGWGVNISKVHYNNPLPQEKKTNFQKNSVNELLSPALHPHNATLQLWLDLGIVGVALAICLIWLILSKLEKIKEDIRQHTSLSTFIAALTIAHSSYGLWHPWWMSSLWIVATLTSAVNFKRKKI